MKLKRPVQFLIPFILMFSFLGSSQPALASTNSVPAQANSMAIDRNLNLWDATNIGLTGPGMIETWHFDFTTSHTFVVTASPITSMGELIPLLTLQDSSGAEITHATSSLTSTLGAGSYSIQVEPETGGGFYLLTFSEVIVQAQFSASASLAVNPSSVNVGDSALMTVSLDTVPAEGYTSAEFSCTYDASLVEVSNIAATSLFGADAAVAVNGPQNGSFIVAVAGSNGNKATSAGDVFTFSAKGLQAGQVSFNCAVKVSKGDDILTQIAPFSISLMVTDSTP